VPKARTCVKNTTSPPRQDQLWSGTWNATFLIQTTGNNTRTGLRLLSCL
jgi:hypothetical protein